VNGCAAGRWAVRALAPSVRCVTAHLGPLNGNNPAT
jgi:hypothetical protein